MDEAETGGGEAGRSGGSGPGDQIDSGGGPAGGQGAGGTGRGDAGNRGDEGVFSGGPYSGSSPLPREGTWTCAQMTAHYNAGGFGRPVDAVCLQMVPDRAAWERISVRFDSGDIVATTKFMLPWKGRTQIPNAFLHSSNLGGSGAGNQFDGVHYVFANTFLTQYFTDDYIDMYFASGNDRVVNGGVLNEMRSQSGSTAFGYVLYGNGWLSCEEQKEVHKQMLESFALRPMARIVSEGLQDADPPPQGCSISVIVLDGG